MTITYFININIINLFHWILKNPEKKPQTINLIINNQRTSAARTLNCRSPEIVAHYSPIVLTRFISNIVKPKIRPQLKTQIHHPPALLRSVRVTSIKYKYSTSPCLADSPLDPGKVYLRGGSQFKLKQQTNEMRVCSLFWLLSCTPCSMATWPRDASFVFRLELSDATMKAERHQRERGARK